MVDSSGIPRGFDVGAIRREVADLKRQVALLGSRRSYVSLDRIVEGGTIAAGVGDKLTETVQEKIVVNGDNLAVDALYGKHIVGPLIETNTEPDVGAKLTDEGFVAHGRARVNSSLDTKIQSTLGPRPAPGYTSGYVQPGVWIDATPDDGDPYTPPQYSAGIFAADAFAGELGLRSARDTLQSSYTQQSVGPGWSSLISYGPEESPTTKARRETRVSLINDGRFDLSAVGPGTPGYPGEVEASVSHEADGVLRLKGKNGVDITGPLVINGAPYTPGGGGTLEPDEDGILRLAGPNGVNVTAPNGPLKLDSTTGVNITGPVTINGQPYSPGVTPGPWLDLPLINGWRITNNLKMRPSYRVTGDIVEFRGSISGGTSNIICQMPAAIRALKEENKVVPQYNTGWVNGTISVAPDGFIRLDTYASNVYSVNLDFSYSRSA